MSYLIHNPGNKLILEPARLFPNSSIPGSGGPLTVGVNVHCVLAVLVRV